MKINLSGHETVVNDITKKYTTEKMNKLCKHYKQIIEADVVLEENHNKTEKTAAVCKVVLKIAGKDLSAHAEAKTIFSAVDEVERKLRAQLEKDKHTHHDAEAKKVRRGKAILRKLFGKQESE